MHFLSRVLSEAACPGIFVQEVWRTIASLTIPTRGAWASKSGGPKFRPARKGAFASPESSHPSRCESRLWFCRPEQSAGRPSIIKNRGQKRVATKRQLALTIAAYCPGQRIDRRQGLQSAKTCLRIFFTL